MSDIVISVENLGKSYLVGHSNVVAERYTALRDVLARNARNLARKTRDMFQGRAIVQGDEVEEFWALKDVSFDLRHGETLGIIGHNGAGKSTLLKILSRITEPTTGRIKIAGRVATLLEVGTGFHPELSGRENIFLNGAILGMTRKEIKDRFDAIVDFAEVEKFLDTPVKRYSSGMYVRLAFSVAAHLECEILIVDEVLAVGDARFQKKCLTKMGEVGKAGRTVLFVSHNMNAIEAMCSRLLVIKGGRLVDDTTDIRTGVTGYLRGENLQLKDSAWENSGSEYLHPVMKPLYFAVTDKNGDPLSRPAANNEELFVRIRILVEQSDPSLSVGICLFNESSELLLWSIATDGPEDEWPMLETGTVELSCALPQRFLNEGVYRMEINAGLHCREYILKPAQRSPAVYFEIRGGLSDSPFWTEARPGLLAPEWKWVRADRKAGA
jgi:lipopolysaccharide transport system ATP-binding protein